MHNSRTNYMNHSIIWEIDTFMAVLRDKLLNGTVYIVFLFRPYKFEDYIHGIDYFPNSVQII